MHTLEGRPRGLDEMTRGTWGQSALIFLRIGMWCSCCMQRGMKCVEEVSTRVLVRTWHNKNCLSRFPILQLDSPNGFGSLGDYGARVGSFYRAVLVRLRAAIRLGSTTDDYMYTTACAIASIASHRIPWALWAAPQSACARHTTFHVKKHRSDPYSMATNKMSHKQKTRARILHANCVPGGAA